MGADERDLVTSEGVDEGSADSGSQPPGDGTLGMPAVGAPENGEQQAAPEELVTGEDEAPAPGQRQQVGEG